MEESISSAEEKVTVRSVRVYGYVRLSPEDDLDRKDVSIANQKRDIDQYCKEKNFELVKVFIDVDIHGWFWSRKILAEMIADAKKNGINLIVVKSYSRLDRDVPHQEMIVRDLNDNDIRVVAINNPQAENHPVLRILEGAMNEEYIRNLRAETEKRHSQRLAQGLPVSRAPFGYRYKHKEWQIVQKEANMVRLVFQLQEQGKTYKEICEAVGISSQVFYTMIKNKETYEGWIVYHKKIRDYTGQIKNIEIIKVKGKHQPILDSASTNIPSIVPSPDI